MLAWSISDLRDLTSPIRDIWYGSKDQSIFTRFSLLKYCYSKSGKGAMLSQGCSHQGDQYTTTKMFDVVESMSLLEVRSKLVYPIWSLGYFLYHELLLDTFIYEFIQHFFVFPRIH